MRKAPWHGNVKGLHFSQLKGGSIMSETHCTLTHEQADEILAYKADAGMFFWKKHKKPGQSLAGGICPQGYWRIKINGKSYKAHRLAWLLSYGVWPSKMIDHINGNKLDNRLSNLRLADNAANQMNRFKACATNKTAGYLGVNYNQMAGRYAARLQFQGKRIHIGYFDTPEEASQAYNARKAALSQFAPSGA